MAFRAALLPRFARASADAFSGPVAARPSGCTSRFRRLGSIRRTAAATDEQKSAAPMEASSKVSSEKLVQDTMEFLKEDLTHLFDEQGIDTSRYDDVVEFRDPVTAYNSVQGYLFNIQLLRRLFAPIFELHDIKQTGEYEITTRWTMTMQFTWNKYSPLRPWWDPKIAFTGISIYGLNEDNGKINKHLDLWDSIDQQEFFSLEAFTHVLRQILNFTRMPDLETPSYTLLKKLSAYEVRQYPPFLVAETNLDFVPKSGALGPMNPASQGSNAFNKLAGYIFGNNAENEKMAMTTPVFTNDSGKMQFVVGKKYKESGMPSPTSEEVVASEMVGGLYAASTFNGLALVDQVDKEYRNLKSLLYRDGVTFNDGWILARYNDPFTNPIFRRNEILIPIESGFNLW